MRLLGIRPKRKVKRRLGRNKSRYGSDRGIAPAAVDYCREKLANIDITLNCRGVDEIVWIAQRVLHTTSKGAALPLKEFSSPMTGTRLLGGLQDAKLIHCVDPDSWKPRDNDIRNAKGRRFLPTAELMLTNIGPVKVTGAAEYHAGDWQPRRVRSSSVYIPAKNASLSLPSHVTRALNAGPGLMFDWHRAASILSKLEEPERSRLCQSTCFSVGCCGGEAVLHTVWEQHETGRIYASAPAIMNLPRKLRPALAAPSGKKVAEVDFSNFEIRILHDLSGVPPPDGDFAESLANRLGAERVAVKLILNAMLHGQTRWNLLFSSKDTKAFALRREVERVLKADHPAVWRTIGKLGRKSTHLQSRGAEVFLPAWSDALSSEGLSAGIPLHDGWVFAADDERQVLKVQELFQSEAGKILGFPTPVKAQILNDGR